MISKKKIEKEVNLIFRNLEGKPIERSSKAIYGIKGDIHDIGSGKSESVWYGTMGRKLDEIKETKIFRGSHATVYIERMTVADDKKWYVALCDENLKPEADKHILSTQQLLDFLYRIK